MSFRFIHTADLHLDAPLSAMAFRDPDLAERIGVASRTAFSRIVDLCIAEQVAFLLIAGDLWDGEYSSTKTPRFLKQELLRLGRAGIRAFIIRGNHDAMARQTGELDPPPLTTVFGASPQTVELEANGHPVAIHGLSFGNIHARESLLPRYPGPRAGAFNIGMLHSSLDGSPGHDPYSPCAVADLMRHGYDYWALGHIHKRAVHRGAATVVMPGIPQGRDIGEAGARSVTLVTVADDNGVTVEERSVAPIRFDRVAVDCGGAGDWADLLDRLEGAIRAAAGAPRAAEHLVLRPVLSGASPLAWRLGRDADRLTEEARALAGDAGVWLDKLELRVTADGAVDAGAHLPAELVRMVLDELPDDPGFLAELGAVAADLASVLPPEARDALGDDAEQQTRLCRDLLARGAPEILSAIAPDEAV